MLICHVEPGPGSFMLQLDRNLAGGTIGNKWEKCCLMTSVQVTVIDVFHFHWLDRPQTGQGNPGGVTSSHVWGRSLHLTMREEQERLFGK